MLSCKLYNVTRICLMLEFTYHFLQSNNESTNICSRIVISGSQAPAFHIWINIGVIASLSVFDGPVLFILSL